MFYEHSKRNHCQPRDPFQKIVAPRLIGWTSTASVSSLLILAP